MFGMSNTDNTRTSLQTGADTVENVLAPETASELHNGNESIHQPVASALPEELSRRKFLSRLSIALGGVVGVVVTAPVIAYLVAPLFNETPEIWRDVGASYDYQVGQTKEVTFTDASPLPWSGVTAKTAAWLRKVSETEFEAFSVNCTHLGCPVSWLPSAGLFECPCHGGVYYSNGTVAGGPPPKPLVKYDVRINALRVEIKASGVPITS